VLQLIQVRYSFLIYIFKRYQFLILKGVAFGRTVHHPTSTTKEQTTNSYTKSQYARPPASSVLSRQKSTENINASMV
jgi:hypothetical protein